MADLADAIGLAAGGIYHYIGSKESLPRPHLRRAHRAAAPAGARGARRQTIRRPVARSSTSGSRTSSSTATTCSSSSKSATSSSRAWRGATCVAAASGSSGSSTTSWPRRGRPAGPVHRPAARALRAARHGQPHRAVVPPRGRLPAAGRRRLRGAARGVTSSVSATGVSTSRRWSGSTSASVSSAPLERVSDTPMTSARRSSARSRASCTPSASSRAVMGPSARLSSAARTWPRTASVSTGLASARLDRGVALLLRLPEHQRQQRARLGRQAGPRASGASAARNRPSLQSK